MMVKWIMDDLHPSLRLEAARERRQIQPPPVLGVRSEIALPWDTAVCLIHLQFFIYNPCDHNMASLS